MKNFAREKLLPPTHPGAVLREDYMLPLGLSANALAIALGVPAPRINDIARERRGITADTALRLARYFRTDAQSWLNLQKHYELETARDLAGAKIDATIKPRAA